MLYRSELGEKVALTEDQLVELVLTQKPWTIIIPRPVPNITKIITEIYTTTNLFRLVRKGKSGVIISKITPIVKIILKYDGSDVTAPFNMMPGHAYYVVNIWPRQSTKNV